MPESRWGRLCGRVAIRSSYRSEVARYVIDAPTLLHLVANDVAVSSAHRLVAPDLIRSQALSLLPAAGRPGEIPGAGGLQRHHRPTEQEVRTLGHRVWRP